MKTKGAKQVTELSFNRVRMMQNDDLTVADIEKATGHKEGTQENIFRAKTWKEWTRRSNARAFKRRADAVSAAYRAKSIEAIMPTNGTKITVTTAQANQLPVTTPEPDALVVATKEDYQSVIDLLDSHIRACNAAHGRVHRRLVGPSGLEGRVQDIEKHLGAQLLEESVFSRKSLLPWRRK